MIYLFHTDPPSAAEPGSEIEIQGRFRSRMRIVAPAVRLAAVPNAGKRTAWAAMQAKREGMAPGFPDLIALAPGMVAFLEFKAKTGALDPNQIDWLNFFHRGGFPCGMFRGAASAVAFLREAGFPVLEAAA